MKSWKDRQSIFSLAMPKPSIQTSALRQLNTSKARSDTNNSSLENAPPKDLVDWLAQLTLLQGVPFEYLVPYSALLPHESIRFFYIDENWQDRLVDGAISVGVSSTQDNMFNAAWYEALYAEVQAQRLKIRTDMRNQSALKEANSIISGFLFRSIVVEAWPGIEIIGTKDGIPLPILRMDRLSSGVLLCLFAGVPDDVQFIEPGEGLHFGLLDDHGKETSKILVRGLGLPEDKPLKGGEQLKTSGGSDDYLTAPATFRDNNNGQEGVVNVLDLQHAIRTAFGTYTTPDGYQPGLSALPDDGTVTPAAIAVQLVRGAGLMDYKTPHSAHQQDNE
ncbi:hypothetical protein [Marinomonas shanghaiensis]|uniref:hypothetical protein n=1 Tax=Marinomonas shanghaiensis TaxID=2202418 RepID=UPI003A8D28BE